MNIENLTKLRDTLIAERALGKDAHMGFNMVDIIAPAGMSASYSLPIEIKDHLNTCGTVACLAGWAFVVAHPEFANEKGAVALPGYRHEPFYVDYADGCRRNPDHIIDDARVWLGLTGEERSDFFGLTNLPEANRRTTLDRALQHLDEIIAAGEFKRWNETVPAV